jgi:hypothetical protein
VFLGWLEYYADGTMSMLPVSGIPAGTTGNVRLYAIWG